MQQDLHQKAHSLLGRSYRNAVVHSHRGSIKSKPSDLKPVDSVAAQCHDNSGFSSQKQLPEFDSNKLNSSSSNPPSESLPKEAFGSVSNLAGPQGKNLKWSA